MGRYIQTPQSNHNKAMFLIADHGARSVSQEDAVAAFNEGREAAICVVDNGIFEAAAYLYDDRELKEFTRPDERRKRTYLVMDREKAEQLAR